MLLRGKYRIDEVIGTGGMAVVYAVTHRNRKRFALKMLHSEWSTRGEIRARFIREGYVANSVEHPGVVSVLDDDVAEDGSTFLVMELLEGATVEARGSRARPMPLRESLAVVIAVLDVLVAAHAKGIVHRDLKPANLFVTREGRVKVLDFGIARLRDATLAATATATGAVLGTPAFMAPEQALALVDDIDARTDLWALGATLFTMLSGSFVHAGGNASQVRVRAATESARSLASVVPDVPAAVAEWVDKALQFDKRARWESAASMRDAALKIQSELFGALEDDCAKGLLEQHGQDFAHSTTAFAPRGELGLAVCETRQSTLESLPNSPEASPSSLTPPQDAPAEGAGKRRVALALLSVAVVAAVTVFAFTRPSPKLQTSLSAASPSSAKAMSAALAVPGGPSSVALAHANDHSTPAPPAMSGQALTHSAAGALGDHVSVAPRSSSRTSTKETRRGLPEPSARARVPAASDVSLAARKPNPLQLDFQ